MEFSEWTSKERTTIDRLNDKVCRRPEMPLKALWYKLIGGGGRLRQIAEREEAREDIYIITNHVTGYSGAGS